MRRAEGDGSVGESGENEQGGNWEPLSSQLKI